MPEGIPPTLTLQFSPAARRRRVIGPSYSMAAFPPQVSSGLLKPALMVGPGSLRQIDASSASDASAPCQRRCR